MGESLEELHRLVDMMWGVYENLFEGVKAHVVARVESSDFFKGAGVLAATVVGAQVLVACSSDDVRGYGESRGRCLFHQQI